jgi:phosphatidylglycerol lysyltransferase
MQSEHRKNTFVEELFVKIVAIAVLTNGIFIILAVLIQLVVSHVMHTVRLDRFVVDSQIIIGITLIYFSNLLKRQKQTAWIVVLLVYAVYLGINFTKLDTRTDYITHHFISIRVLNDLILPIIILIGLIIARSAYTVKSDIRSFGSSIRIGVIIFLVTFFYGVIGFRLMDESSFHQDFSVANAAHRTIDQLNLTTPNKLVPHTRRARLFEDSLSIISIAGITYILISLFQPLKARYEDQTANRQLAIKLLESGIGDSEDFFKIWPHDKTYFFNESKTAGLAYRVQRGVALVAGDPFGAVADFKNLVIDFSEFCRLNDWQTSFIHTMAHFNPLYRNEDYTLQKVGEEAVINVDHFEKAVVRNKYFRNVANKFEKNGYTTEVLKPPHSKETLKDLKRVSDEWLKLPGRSERGFMIGYFSYSYISTCNIVVLRDENGVIQAFINQIRSFAHEEANYDMIRHTKSTLGNSSDYLLINFIKFAKKDGYNKVSLGFCPLVGLSKVNDNKNIIDGTLRFLYSNGDRLYSFSGLYRFKQKYEPEWSDRYIAYKGGISGFTRTANAVNKAMRPHRIHGHKDND